MSQYDDNGVLYSIAFYSKKYILDKYNYKIYNLELMVIIRSFEDWQLKLKGAYYLI
jgi:hypothetical protein